MSNNDPTDGNLPVMRTPAQLSLFSSEEIARPEYNIGKWAGVIFISPHSRDVTNTREFAFQTNNNGQRSEAKIVITPMKDHKTPTTTSFKVYLALVQLWNHQGRPQNGLVKFSGRDIAEVAGWSWSGAIAKRVEEHLRILAGTNLDWSFTFKTKEGVQEQVSQMHILDEVHYLKRKIASQKKFTQNHWVRFSPGLVANMINKLERPINFKTLASIRSENSSNLYVLLDIFLARKTKWERAAFDLLYKDLGYTGKRYESKRARKQRLEEFKKDLDGLSLVRGTLSIQVCENSAKTDWKLVARKIVPQISGRSGGKRIATPEEAEEIANEIVEQLARQPKSGNPRMGYMAFLAQYVPRHILFEALSIAKADYNPANTKSTLTHVFVGIVQEMAEKSGVALPKKR